MSKLLYYKNFCESNPDRLNIKNIELFLQTRFDNFRKFLTHLEIYIIVDIYLKYKKKHIFRLHEDSDYFLYCELRNRKILSKIKYLQETNKISDELLPDFLYHRYTSKLVDIGNCGETNLLFLNVKTGKVILTNYSDESNKGYFYVFDTFAEFIGLVNQYEIMKNEKELDDEDEFEFVKFIQDETEYPAFSFPNEHSFDGDDFNTLIQVGFFDLEIEHKDSFVKDFCKKYPEFNGLLKLF